MSGEACNYILFLKKQTISQLDLMYPVYNRRDHAVLSDEIIKTRRNTTRLLRSPFHVASQSVQTVNGCHQINLFCNVIKLNIFCFRNKMSHHLKSLIFDCLSFTEGLITSLSTTDRDAPDFNRRSTTSELPLAAAP